MAKKIQDERQVQQAIKLFRAFTGSEPGSLDIVTAPPTDAVLLTMGECLGVIYEAKRDGKKEKYVHQFRKKSAPKLAVSADGKHLYLIGGQYRVTESGIEDK